MLICNKQKYIYLGRDIGIRNSNFISDCVEYIIGGLYKFLLNIVIYIIISYLFG